MSNERVIEISVPSRLEDLRLLGVGLRSVCEQFVPASRAQLIELCAIEIATNCVKHAYGGEEAGQVSVRAAIGAGGIVVDVRDTGRSIPTEVLASEADPFAFDEADTMSLPEGGMGLALVRSSADSVEYLRVGEHNVMRMTFLPTPCEASGFEETAEN